MLEKKVHLIVKGRVQGVCFRAFTESLANRLMLKGRVRNVSDGSVEITAEGNEEILKKFVAEVRKGPPGSLVREILENWGEATGEFSDFDIIYWDARY